MKTKTVREFEVGDAFLRKDGQILVIRQVIHEIDRVLFYATHPHYGDFEWLNQILDEGGAAYLGKMEFAEEVKV